MCAAAGSVAEKNGTKPRRQENGKQAGTGNFVPDLGTGNRRPQISGISGSKNRASAGDPVRRTGDGTALSDFFDDRRFRAIDRTASPGQRGRRPDVCTGAEVGDEKLRKISVSVPEQELSEEEASALLDQAQAELERWVAAIPNPDSVEDDLDLPERFCGGLVTGSWQSDCYDLMDASGQIRKQWVEEGGELVVLSVRLRCVEQEPGMFLCSADCAKGRQSGRSTDARNRTAAGSRAQFAASVGSAARKHWKSSL